MDCDCFAINCCPCFGIPLEENDSIPSVYSLSAVFMYPFLWKFILERILSTMLQLAEKENWPRHCSSWLWYLIVVAGICFSFHHWYYNFALPILVSMWLNYTYVLYYANSFDNLILHTIRMLEFRVTLFSLCERQQKQVQDSPLRMFPHSKGRYSQAKFVDN